MTYIRRRRRPARHSLAFSPNPHAHLCFIVCLSSCFSWQAEGERKGPGAGEGWGFRGWGGGCGSPHRLKRQEEEEADVRYGGVQVSIFLLLLVERTMRARLAVCMSLHVVHCSSLGGTRAGRGEGCVVQMLGHFSGPLVFTERDTTRSEVGFLQ